jgi:hypothetical protein
MNFKNVNEGNFVNNIKNIQPNFQIMLKNIINLQNGFHNNL